MNNLKAAIRNGDEKMSEQLVLNKKKLSGLNKEECRERENFVKREAAEFFSFLAFCLSGAVFGACSVAVVVGFWLMDPNAFSLAVSQEEV